jgi:hypothetical protein
MIVSAMVLKSKCGIAGLRYANPLEHYASCAQLI